MHTTVCTERYVVSCKPVQLCEARPVSFNVRENMFFFKKKFNSILIIVNEI